jgi:tetratricopeptide (TPR) repeat protein
MMKPLHISILFCLLQVPAFCCLNYYYTADKDGHLHYQGDEHNIMIGFNTNFNLRLLSEKVVKQEETVKAEKSFEALSDYSVMLMKMGKNNVALTILQSLYAAHPDQYQLAANLGTSYELAGEVDSALKYIKRGIVLNPNAHDGSEWVHVKVLETKIKLRTDSLYLKSNTVLGLNKEQEYDTLVAHQIEIQLRERFPFCPGPDPIMASLMEDFADITLNINSIEDAKTYYNICKYYFGDSSATINEKIKETMNLIEKHSNVRPEERRNEGDNVRLGPYRYTEMLDDNNPDKFEVNWTKINTDAVALLQVVGLKPVPEKTDTTEVPPVAVTPTEADAAVEEQDSMWWIIIVVLACCSTFVSFLWYKKRKNK